MSRREYACRAYFVVSFLAFVAIVVFSSQPPLLRDYPDWVYQGVLLTKAVAGHPVAGYALKLYPVPNSITTVGIAVLTLAFGWFWAAKLWMLVYLAVAFVTVFIVSRTFALPDWLWLAMPAVFFFGQGFWYATISFNLGLCVLLILLSVLYQRKEGIAPVIALLTLCYFLHLIIYVAAGILLLLYCFEYRRWKLLAFSAITVPLPVWYFVARIATHSNESNLGSSPPSHVAAIALFVIAYLSLVVWRRDPAISRWTVRLSALSAGLLVCITVVLLFVHNPRFASVALLARHKVLSLFQLFGFMNIIYFPSEVPLQSATLAVLHRPLFVICIALDCLCGLTFLGAISQSLMKTPSSRNPAENNQEYVFIRNFVALFAMLYLMCPPNAMGVIGIDLRLAQLAFVVGMVVFAARISHAWAIRCAWTAPTTVVLCLLSMFQFTASQNRIALPVADASFLPPQIAAFGAVDPTALSEEYDRLRTGKLEGYIFTTGLFSQTYPWTDQRYPGR